MFDDDLDYPFCSHTAPLAQQSQHRLVTLSQINMAVLYAAAWKKEEGRKTQPQLRS